MSATRITVLGDHTPSYPTHLEIDAVLARLREQGFDAGWVETDAPEAAELGAPGSVDGLWIAPGGPYRDVDALLAAIGRARAGGVPLLGTCGGYQHIALELGAALAGVEDPRHAESDPDAADPFIAPLDCRVDGERRTVTCTPGTRLAELLGTEPFAGHFVCGFAPTDAAAEALERAGVRIAARAQDVGAAALELPGHPFLMATLFHPQVGTLAGEPLSPLITAFTDAARRSCGAHAHG
ncbi:CTP synthase [Baekduia alba]|uniref:glutamine amidotransferase-related protein n=1 Tax=Baekduia alba TaxID=2997333 RepID=UPI00233FADCD|nr:gamma-glutamyl-gamma-aminobutyrate hydrolase family protein [Baekduia alba]WCB92519.1 CTP synthase [Baekduia alba]